MVQKIKEKMHMIKICISKFDILNKLCIIGKVSFDPRRKENEKNSSHHR